MSTDDQVKGNLDAQAGQTQDNQGDSTAGQDSQPNLVELPTGEKVTVEELRGGYMKDADYRKKTAELAEERRRLAEERERFPRQPASAARGALANQAPWQGDEEETDPLQALAREVVGLKVAYARDFLKRTIDGLAESKYPDMDKKAVYDACWANPNAVIEDEAKRSHEEVERRVAERASKVKAPANLDEYFKANPKAKEEYDRRLIDAYNAKKTQKTDAAVGGGSGSGSGATFHDDEKRPVSYSEATRKLKERLGEKTEPF